MPMSFRSTLLAVGLLAGCASTPAGPYWNNTKWVDSLGSTVQTDLKFIPHVRGAETASGTAVIKFIYDNGRLIEPGILSSTGFPLIDQAILAQVPSIRPPLAQGLDTNIPHGFALRVTVYTGHMAFADPAEEIFVRAIHKSLRDQIRYPSAAVRDHTYGTVVINFKYHQNTIVDAQIASSSGSKELDDAVLNELLHAKLPPAPIQFASDTFKFSAPFVFSINGVQLQYAPAQTISTVKQSRCADVGLRYQGGNISNVHLLKSSDDAALDQRAILEVTQQKIPLPPAPSGSSVTDYRIPVCTNN